MDARDHKGTEFSNVSKTWSENENKEKDNVQLPGRGADFSSVTETWDKNEKEKEKFNADDEGMKEKSLGTDYWDRVADDVASGYTTDKDDDDILNIDQLPDDHQRGDAAKE